MNGNKNGEWVTVRPDDPRIVDGSRVRLNGDAGTAIVSPALLACQIDGLSPSAWFVRDTNGPDVELWVPAEVTLPLPTEPGVFWGRVKYNDETYVGWVLHSDVPGNDAYLTLRPVSGNRWHYASHVTRLPVPDEELEKMN